MNGYELLLTLPVAGVAGLAAVTNEKGRRARLALRREGLCTTQLVKQLLIDLQQHRGMTNAYLNGDAAFKTRVEAKQADIGKDIGLLDRSSGHGLLTARRWDGIKRAWQALRGTALTLTEEESFRRHSALIRDVLYSMADVAERSQIFFAGADPALVNALWTDLPAVAEGVGQARGIGSGVAAKGYCSSVARVKLRFLQDRIDETLERVSGDFGEVTIVRVLGASFAGEWRETSRAVREFLALLEGKLIDSAKPAVDAEHYFSAGTQALDAVFRVFDHVSKALDESLAPRA